MATQATDQIDQESETETVEAAAAREQFDGLVDRVADGSARFVVERAGKPVAAVVSIRDLARLQVDDERLAERRRILEAFGEPFKDLSPDEIQQEVDRAIAAAREKRRQDSTVAAE